MKCSARCSVLNKNLFVNVHMHATILFHNCQKKGEYGQRVWVRKYKWYKNVRQINDNSYFWQSSWNSVSRWHLFWLMLFAKQGARALLTNFNIISPKMTDANLFTTFRLQWNFFLSLLGLRGKNTSCKSSFNIWAPFNTVKGIPGSTAT